MTCGPLRRRALEQALKRRGLTYRIDQGGGAFYGPKIDVKFNDAIGREWQGSTIQLDFPAPGALPLSTARTPARISRS